MPEEGKTRKKTARQRREQKERAEARCINRLLRLAQLEHRGHRTPALAALMQVQQQPPRPLQELLQPQLYKMVFVPAGAAPPPQSIVVSTGAHGSAGAHDEEDARRVDPQPPTAELRQVIQESQKIGVAQVPHEGVEDRKDAGALEGEAQEGAGAHETACAHEDTSAHVCYSAHGGISADATRVDLQPPTPEPLQEIQKCQKIGVAQGSHEGVEDRKDILDEPTAALTVISDDDECAVTCTAADAHADARAAMNRLAKEAPRDRPLCCRPLGASTSPMCGNNVVCVKNMPDDSADPPCLWCGADIADYFSYLRCACGSLCLLCSVDRIHAHECDVAHASAAEADLLAEFMEEPRPKAKNKSKRPQRPI